MVICMQVTWDLGVIMMPAGTGTATGTESAIGTEAGLTATGMTATERGTALITVVAPSGSGITGQHSHLLLQHLCLRYPWLHIRGDDAYQLDEFLMALEIWQWTRSSPIYKPSRMVLCRMGRTNDGIMTVTRGMCCRNRSKQSQ